MRIAAYFVGFALIAPVGLLLAGDVITDYQSIYWVVPCFNIFAALLCLENKASRRALLLLAILMPLMALGARWVSTLGFTIVPFEWRDVLIILLSQGVLFALFYKTRSARTAFFTKIVVATTCSLLVSLLQVSLFDQPFISSKVQGVLLTSDKFDVTALGPTLAWEDVKNGRVYVMTQSLLANSPVDFGIRDERLGFRATYNGIRIATSNPEKGNISVDDYKILDGELVLLSNSTLAVSKQLIPSLFGRYKRLSPRGDHIALLRGSSLSVGDDGISNHTLKAETESIEFAGWQDDDVAVWYSSVENRLILQDLETDSEEICENIAVDIAKSVLTVSPTRKWLAEIRPSVAEIRFHNLNSGAITTHNVPGALRPKSYSMPVWLPENRLCQVTEKGLVISTSADTGEVVYLSVPLSYANTLSYTRQSRTLYWTGISDPSSAYELFRVTV